MKFGSKVVVVKPERTRKAQDRDDQLRAVEKLLKEDERTKEQEVKIFRDKSSRGVSVGTEAVFKQDPRDLTGIFCEMFRDLEAPVP